MACRQSTGLSITNQAGIPFPSEPDDDINIAGVYPDDEHNENEEHHKNVNAENHGNHDNDC